MRGRDHSNTILSPWLASALFIDIDPAKQRCHHAESGPSHISSYCGPLTRNLHLFPELMQEAGGICLGLLTIKVIVWSKSSPLLRFWGKKVAWIKSCHLYIYGPQDPLLQP